MNKDKFLIKEDKEVTQEINQILLYVIITIIGLLGFCLWLVIK